MDYPESRKVGPSTGGVQDNLKKQVVEWTRLLRSIPTDFKPAVHALLIILIPSTVLLPLSYVAPPVVVSLKSSWDTPWGVFTSIWIHYDVEHYAGNMLILALFLLLFLRIHEHHSRDEKLRRSRVLIWNPVLSAVTANIYTLIVLPLSTSAGASGAVFAYFGICLGYLSADVYPPSFRMKNLREHFRKPEIIRTVLVGLSILAVFLVSFVTNTVPAHLIGFWFAIATTRIYETFRE